MIMKNEKKKIQTTKTDTAVYSSTHYSQELK